MALRDYYEEIRTQKRKLYAAVCIYQKPGSGTASPVNEMIEKLVSGLKEELPDYEEIRLAYVYETGGLQGCMPFMPMQADTEPFYMEPLDNEDNHSIDHVFFMGMALLDNINETESGECRLYLVTDDRIPRVNELLWKDEGDEAINPRFSDTDAEIVIVKSKDTEDAEIDKIIRKSRRIGTIVL